MQIKPAFSLRTLVLTQTSSTHTVLCSTIVCSEGYLHC